MNRLEGIITSVESSGNISLVELDVMGDTFAALMIETPQSNPLLRTGETVQLLFKETEVSIAKALSGGISCRNRPRCTVSAIEPSEILTKLTLDFRGVKIVSVITTRSAKALGLAVGDEVEGIVKANEISLKKAPA
jgi:molybdate transport system regulatory protein